MVSPVTHTWPFASDVPDPTTAPPELVTLKVAPASAVLPLVLVFVMRAAPGFGTSTNVKVIVSVVLEMVAVWALAVKKLGGVTVSATQYVPNGTPVVEPLLKVQLPLAPVVQVKAGVTAAPLQTVPFGLPLKSWKVAPASGLPELSCLWMLMVPQLLIFAVVGAMKSLTSAVNDAE